MAAIAERARVAPPAERPRRRPVERRVARRRVAGGVVWIAVVAALLAGVVALNVAVLQLNLRMDSLNSERAKLRADNAALQSQLSSASAAGRIEALARRQLGVVPADPNQTTYVGLGR
jgi:cell division protein FtsL